MAPEGKDNVKGQACLGCKRNGLRLEPHVGEIVIVEKERLKQRQQREFFANIPAI